MMSSIGWVRPLGRKTVNSNQWTVVSVWVLDIPTGELDFVSKDDGKYRMGVSAGEDGE